MDRCLCALASLPVNRDAAPLHAEALEIRVAAFGPSHALVAQSMHNLGLLRRAQGDQRDGDRLLREALAIQEKVLPPDHPDTKATRAALKLDQNPR